MDYARFSPEEAVELTFDDQRAWLAWAHKRIVAARPAMVDALDYLARYGAALLVAHREVGGNLLDVAGERDRARDLAATLEAELARDQEANLRLAQQVRETQGPLARMLRDLQRIREVLDDFRDRKVNSQEVVQVVDAIVAGGTPVLADTDDVIAAIDAQAAEVVDTARTLGGLIGRVGSIRAAAVSAFVEGLMDGTRR